MVDDDQPSIATHRPGKTDPAVSHCVDRGAGRLVIILGRVVLDPNLISAIGRKAGHKWCRRGIDTGVQRESGENDGQDSGDGMQPASSNIKRIDPTRRHRWSMPFGFFI